MTAPTMFRHSIHVALLASLVLGLCGTRPTRAQDGNPPHGQGESVSQPATGQTESAAPTSLGELARRQRAAQAEASGESVKSFTNDDLPKAGDLTISAPREGGSGANAKGKPEAIQSGHGEEHYRARAQELQNLLETHQRELEVLQQELGENQVQYYPNPSEALHQQYSRGDISGLREAIDKKRQQVDADQQAISELEDELRREGSASQSLETAGPQPATPAVKLDLSGVPKGSEEYWRRRFSAAREALASAQEQRQLAEDELRLLQSQQAHDWGTSAAESAESKIADKESEVESKRAAEAQAQQELDALENEFRQSGAPEEWSSPGPAGTDVPGSPQSPTPDLQVQPPLVSASPRSDV